MAPRQSLAQLRRSVHRFTGVVDRFGSFASGGDTTHTLCVRDLRLADSDSPLDPDHWWFRAREVWTRSGLQVGDTVLFTAKVQRASKGRHDPPEQHRGNPRRQVVGFASTPRSVVVLRRRQGSRQLLERLSSTLAQRESHLSVTLEEQERIAASYADLLQRHEALEGQLQDAREARRLLEARLGDGLAGMQALQQRHRRRLALVAALSLSAGGLGAGAIAAALQHSGAEASHPLPHLRR